MICNDCDYAGSPTYDFPCSSCDMTKGSPFCCYEHEEKPTNADHIRAMSNEELARFLLMEVVNDKCYGICHGSCTGNDCISGIVKWLNSEYKEK